jgi:hypothetical protein
VLYALMALAFAGGDTCPKQFHQPKAISYARSVYQRDSISKKSKARMKLQIRCQLGGKQARRNVRRARRTFKQRWIARRSLTPYGSWAIPGAIVMCESHGSWSAYNPSGARGPYQFLGWKVPWPVRTEADKAAHHRMAAKLWNGGAGASHWVCKA